MAATGRLNVMFAADVVGYPSLITADREGTLERVQAHLHQFVNPKIAEHDGYIVKLTGDSLLVEFASPVEAVQCAVKLQRGMIDREIDTAPDRRIMFRIGVAIGQATANGDDLVGRAVAALPVHKLARLIKPGTGIYGDGGNTALRVAALADPGGICVSGAVWDAIRDQLPYRFEDIGEQNLDLRAAPVHCYAMSAAAVAARPRVAPQHRTGSASRRGWLRSAAIATSTFAVAGVSAVTLWAWLGASSSTAPVAAPVTAVSHMPAVSSTADQGSHAWSAPLSPPMSNTAAERDTHVPSAQPTLFDVTAAVVRGKPASSPPQTVPDGNTVVLKGIAAPSALHTAADSGTAVIRGK